VSSVGSFFSYIVLHFFSIQSCKNWEWLNYESKHVAAIRFLIKGCCFWRIFIGTITGIKITLYGVPAAADTVAVSPVITLGWNNEKRIARLRSDLGLSSGQSPRSARRPWWITGQLPLRQGWLPLSRYNIQ